MHRIRMYQVLHADKQFMTDLQKCAALYFAGIDIHFPRFGIALNFAVVHKRLIYTALSVLIATNEISNLYGIIMQSLPSKVNLGISIIHINFKGAVAKEKNFIYQAIMKKQKLKVFSF